MAVEARFAAKRFCRAAGWNVRATALPKLLFLAHGDYLSKTGRPLIAGQPFAATISGPHIPAIDYLAAKWAGKPALPRRAFWFVSSASDEEAIRFIDSRAPDLARLGYREVLDRALWSNGAWANNYRFASDMPISDACILKDWKVFRAMEMQGGKERRPDTKGSDGALDSLESGLAIEI